MNSNYHDDIYRTLLLSDALKTKTKRELFDRLEQYETSYLYELSGFLYELHQKRMNNILKTFSASLFKLTPQSFKAWAQPYMDHFLRLCRYIDGSAHWASICRSMISGLNNYAAYRSGTMTRETVGRLLEATAIINTTGADLAHNNEELYRHIEHYGSLPEGELRTFIISSPDSLTHLKTFLRNGDLRIAELIAVTNKETHLVLASGAL